MIMRRVRDAMSEVLDRTTLAELIKEVEEGIARRKPAEPIMYHI
jgi:DNA-binding IscR family transcriptional regulator